MKYIKKIFQLNQIYLSKEFVKSKKKKTCYLITKRFNIYVNIYFVKIF